MKDLDFITGRHLGLNTEFPLRIIIPRELDRNRNYRQFRSKPPPLSLTHLEETEDTEG